MAKTFRQEVDGLIADLLQEIGFKDSELLKTKKRYSDRICEAAKRRLGDGMPKVNCRLDPEIDKVSYAYDQFTINRQYTEGQAHIAKECGEPQHSVKVQEKQCTAPWKKSNCLCEKTCPIVEDGSICKYFSKPTPTLREQMPLIDSSQINYDGWPEEVVQFAVKQQRDADMAWYRAKLEEIAEGLPKVSVLWHTEIINARDAELKACRDYILKQREG